MKLVGDWRSAGRMEGVRNVLKVSELNNSVKGHTRRACVENMKCGEGEVESVEKEWEKFRDIVMECANDVCGMRRVGGQRRKGVNGGTKKGVEQRQKREELLRNGFREEIGLPMTDTGHREWL